MPSSMAVNLICYLAREYPKITPWSPGQVLCRAFPDSHFVPRLFPAVGKEQRRLGTLYPHPCSQREVLVITTKLILFFFSTEFTDSPCNSAQVFLVFVLGAAFLFGAIYPLANNGLRFATADRSMSGAATGLRQQEIDERLSPIPAFAVTDEKGSPFVAEKGDGATARGYFFLDPNDAEKYKARIQVTHSVAQSDSSNDRK